MSKRIRLIILFACIACFFAIAPVLVLYSMGYRFDFETMKITATGGIYVKTFPAAGQIIIDSKDPVKPGIFSNSVFIQSLLPKNHSVLITKDGYYNYFKTIPVAENEVTKLENVILFRKDIKFQVIEQGIQSPFDRKDKFVIKSGGLYYSDSIENADITALQKSTPIISGVISFSNTNNKIIWLATDGFLYTSDLQGLSAQTQKNATKLNLEPIKITKSGSYKIISDGQSVFVLNNDALLLLDSKANTLEQISKHVIGAEISPDGKKAVYYDANNIYVLHAGMPQEKVHSSLEKITGCMWLNDNYVVFSAGNEIRISEIDIRGNINVVTLPQSVVLSPDERIDIKNPKIFFDQQDEKLYVLTDKTLLLSEKIIP